MSLILDICAWWQIQNSSERITNAIGDSSVIGRTIPYGKDVFLIANGYDRATNFFTNHELLKYLLMTDVIIFKKVKKK